MDLSIIIVNWRSHAYVRQCLTSLFCHCPGDGREIIVVDGGSYDGIDQMLTREFPCVIFIQSRENIGFARANNLGAQRARGRYLLFLNPDTEFFENSLGILCQEMELLPSAGVIGCRLLNRDRSLQSSCVQSLPTVMNQLLDCDFLRGLFPHSSLWGTSALWAPGSAPAEVEAVSGACLLARQKDFLGVGGFSENYFMYGEDLDLCFKIRRAGAKIFYIPGTSLVHFGGGSSSRAPSNSSVILMRESVQRFIGSNQGPWAARGYRLAMALAALFRLVVLSPLLLGRKADRSAAGAWAKWWAILRWSMGLSSSVKS